MLVIISQLKTAHFFSISIGLTLDVSRKEQISLIVFYLEKSGKINKILLAMWDSALITGHTIFNLFLKVMDNHNIEGKSYLIRQSYGGASIMQSKYNRLQTKIKEACLQALMWALCVCESCMTSCVECCSAAENLFGKLEKLCCMYVFINCSKKRNSIYREKQKLLYPKARIQVIKKWKLWISNLCTNYHVKNAIPL